MRIEKHIQIFWFVSILFLLLEIHALFTVLQGSIFLVALYPPYSPQLLIGAINREDLVRGIYI